MRDKIITLTFNPAIDKSASVPLLIPEKKLNCSTPTYEPGGGGINVSRAIKRLEGSSTAIYLAGGYTGRIFTKLISAEGLDIRAIKTRGSTRENVVIKEMQSNLQYRFGMPGEKVYPREWKNCLTAIEQIKNVAYIVASGSLQSGVPRDIFAKISEIARSKNARLIVDTSAEPLRRAVEAGVYLIKPNLKELASLVNKDFLSIDQVTDASKEVIRKFKCEIVITSLGPEGAILVTKDIAFKITVPNVRVQSTVGAGDSMLAGIVLSLARKKNLIASAQYGVACGSAATMNPGTELCHLKDVNLLYSIISKNASSI
ncbi:6-phosphofructokinase isozyme 2 [compost metagenome]